MWRIRRFRSDSLALWDDAVRTIPPLAWLLAGLTYPRTAFRSLQTDYYAFCTTETKKRWRWEKLYQEERKYWFTFGFHGWLLLLTIIYEVAVPIHAGLAIIPPMLVSLLATTRPFTSGVALGLYLMLPLKFFPLKDWVRVAMAVTGVGAGA